MFANAVIRLTNVDIFQQNQLVLSRVNFEVNKSELVYLIGQTGSGKSSLLKVLYGDLHIKTGEGVVAGYDLKKLTTIEVPFLRRKIGIVFQDFQLLNDRSVEKNLEFVLRATGWTNEIESSARIREVLDKVGLRSKIAKMPHELSGGEQQRVVIARALLNNPEVILADEPTGHLDPETSEEIAQLLHQISQTGTAVVLATHDYHIIRTHPARILNCDNGQVQEKASI
ncbi:MAG: ATP-binding cassette domain-containing protein [Sphingobacteriaceae bacterium]|nr:ATP-binding cassette domain-containing protein [Sphingobacteriaceae bacterium]